MFIISKSVINLHVNVPCNILYLELNVHTILVEILTYGVKKILQWFLRIDVPTGESHCARSKVILVVKQ